MEKQTLIHFLDSIRSYEHEAGKSLAKDERESEIFVDIYLNENPIPDPKFINVVETITFAQFIAYGKHITDTVDGMPWAFKYKGHPVTHENDKCYLVETKLGLKEFTPKHVLFIDIHGDIYPHEIYVEPDQVKEEEVEQVACDGMQHDWNDSAYQGGFKDGAKWMQERLNK